MTECLGQLSLGFLGHREVVGEFSGGNLSSDGGLMLLAEADRALGLTTSLARLLPDHRDPTKVIHRLDEMLAPGQPVVTYHDFAYQAGTWDRPRRVVSKVEWHAGELFPRVGFIVTNRTDRAQGVVRFYNGRGTCEQWIKEGKHAVEWMRLSCHQFQDNAVRLALLVLAYNLGNFLRRLALPKPMASWSLTILRERLVKIGARLTRHARRLALQMAEAAIPQDLFGQILTRIRRLSPVPT